MGQFGSLYDMTRYSTRNHTVFGAANYQVNPQLSLFANVVYNEGRSSLGGLNLDTRQISAVPTGFDYSAVSDLGTYSALNVRRVQAVAGMNYAFSPRWTFSWTAYYGRYQDFQPYLLDTNGRSTGVQGGISYNF